MLAASWKCGWGGLSLVVWLAVVVQAAGVKERPGDGVENMPRKIIEVGDAAGEAYLDQLADVLDAFGAFDVEKGVGLLDSTGTARNTPMFVTMQAQFNAMRPNAGEYLGYEVLTVKRVSSRVHEVRAMIYFDRLPLVFTVRLYRPHDKWQFFGGFNFTGDLNAIIAHEVPPALAAKQGGLRK